MIARLQNGQRLHEEKPLNPYREGAPQRQEARRGLLLLLLLPHAIERRLREKIGMRMGLMRTDAAPAASAFIAVRTRLSALWASAADSGATARCAPSTAA